jgi:membrane protease YdiL (CAAX protease family)
MCKIIFRLKHIEIDMIGEYINCMARSDNETTACVEQDIQPHSIRQSIVLHLLPGGLLLVFFVLAAPLAGHFGFPALFALILGELIVLIPFELGVLFYEGKKRNGKFSLTGIVVYRERIPLGQYFLWVPLLVVWTSICLILLSPLDNFLIKTVFSGLPAWFISSDISGYSMAIQIMAAAMFAVSNITAAIVEELYFRGYLLPRLSRLQGWAPLINTVLFSLQHFFSPWRYLFIFLGVLPQAYIVFKRRNVYLGIIAHSLLNLLSAILLIVSVFN